MQLNQDASSEIVFCAELKNTKEYEITFIYVQEEWVAVQHE